MLHTSKKKNSKKPLIIAVSILAVLVIGWLYYAHHFQTWPFNSTNKPQASPTNNKIDYSQPSNDQTKSGANIKSQIADSSKDGGTNSSSTAQQNTLNVSITAVQPGQTIRIRTIIDTVTSSAKCTLNMSGPNGKSYTATAATQPMASSSTCQGFDIPMTSLSSGDWQISITVTDGSSTGSATAEKAL